MTKAAVARAASAPLAIETLALAEPGVGEVLVRLIAAGVSRADLDAIADAASPFPFVGGRAGAGIVEGVGLEVTGLAAGDAVVILRAAWPRPDGTRPFDADRVATLGASSFAGHCLCRAGDLCHVAGEAPLELLAGLDEEMRDAVAAVVRAGRSEVGGAIVVAGAGAAGLAALMAARALGLSPVVVVDPAEDRRQLASELGAALTVHTDDDLAAVVRSLTGAGAGFVLDTTGHSETVEACRRALAPGGACVGLRGSAPVTPSEDQDAVIATVAGWHAQGRFPIEVLIAFFPFEHANDALAALADNSVVKPVLRFSLGPFAGLDRAGSAGAAADEPAGDAGDRPEPTEAESEGFSAPVPVPEPG